MTAIAEPSATFFGVAVAYTFVSVTVTPGIAAVVITGLGATVVVVTG